ncbi:MAG: peptide chain release factor-like protein [Desulfotignum sp.]|nr:peptide chain release factor-like protein [Desulfotignum sp.]MCF8113167.1 peptide chain release factor-like protein [Desulfotignum sp.]
MGSDRNGPSEKKLAALEQKLAELGIRKTDLEEKFIKASGRGGQKVNKSSSAVFIRHRETGLSVKVGRHRSLHLNRFVALRALAEKIEAERAGKDAALTEHIRKIRRQKKRRKQKNRQKLSASRDTTDE